MQVSLDLADFPAGDRGDVWHSAASRLFVPVDAVSDGDEPRVRLSACDVAGLRAVSLSAGPGEVTRSPRLVEQSNEAFVIVGLHISGSCVATQGRQETLLGPGDIECQVTTKPYRYKFRTAFDKAMVRLPYACLGLSDGVLEQVSGLPIPSDAGVGRLLAPLLTDFVSDAQRYLGPGEQDLSIAIVELIRSAVLQRVGDNPGASGQTKEALRAAIIRFVEENLREADLTPSAVAAEHCISTRYLHRLFAEAGTTFGTCVRSRRLRAAARMLRDPHTAHRTVESVAASCGFRDPAHFSRVFKGSFGVTPRQWRSNR